MKKILALILTVAMVFAMGAVLTGCNSDKEPSSSSDSSQTTAKSDFKIGLICLHDENSTYDNNFIQALTEVQNKLGLSNDQVLIKTNIPESDACTNAAEELVDEGCDVIFADSFGHESYILGVAKEHPEVQFCHATGTKAATAGVANFHNAFAAIYQGRFLAGIAAGMKLNEMIEKGTIKANEAVIGYVGAFNYAEVVSGMTSFFLGARYVCPSATMKVTYTNSWFDIALEKDAALSLINSGCKLISQHADSEGAPKACEEKGVPNVAYNISTISMGPNTALISSKINWAPYFEMIIKSVQNNESFPTDYCGTMKEGYVELTELNTKVAAEGTQEKIDEAKAKLESGELKVFDTSTFTVKGKKLDSYSADVIDEGDFKPETEVIENGEFAESSKRSAPYFDIKYIDGISE